MENWKPWLKRKSYQASAFNLAAYLAFRKRDFRPYQDALYPLGLSSMSNCESHVLQNLDVVIHALYALDRLRPFSKYYGDSEELEQIENNSERHLDFSMGRHSLDQSITALLGKKSHGRRTRIVVTLPTEAANDKKWMLQLIENGADICRINCAHDDGDIWQRMIENIRLSERKIGKQVRVLMDLAGPKIRTGSVVALHRRDKLQAGDGLWLQSESVSTRTGEAPAVFGKEKVDAQFRVTCTLPEVLSNAKKGERVFIDDGQFVGKIIGRWGSACYVLIERGPEGGKRLKPDKGINLPDTDFTLEIPTLNDFRIIALSD